MPDKERGPEKMGKMTNRRGKGFTLVELLIVIIIIGVLAGIMMLSAQSSMDKAEATKVVNNLRQLKAAALMRYAEVGSWETVLYKYKADAPLFYPALLIQDLAQTYLGKELSEEESSVYSVRSSDYGVYIRCTLNSLYSDSSKLANVEKALVALTKRGAPLYEGSFSDKPYLDANQKYVSMRITNGK